jgi:light-harvesting complex I chlorophyll a/b binding protein 1
MKSIAALALIGSAAAFAPAPVSRVGSSLDYAKELDSMPTSVECPKVFDPLGLSDYVPVDWARRAELSNGRSAMLATVGWFFPKIFGTFDSQDVTTTDPIDAILQADPQWWAQWILICGVFETYKYKKEMEGKSFLGGDEPAVDYLKLWPADEAGRADMRMKELKNGRLAMIGIAGFVANHILPGSCPVPDFIA